MLRRRLARAGRLSLDSANSGKTDCEEESKESFSHAGEANQTAGVQSTISSEQPICDGENGKVSGTDKSG